MVMLPLDYLSVEVFMSTNLIIGMCLQVGHGDYNVAVGMDGFKNLGLVNQPLITMK